MKISESAVKLVKTVMNTAMGHAKFLCERYRGTCDLYIFYADCGILPPYAIMKNMGIAH